MRRKLVAALLVATMAGLSVYGVVWWLGRGRAREAAGSLVVLPVRRGTVELTVTGSGALMPEERRAVRSEVTATVVRVGFEEGARVAAGDVLIELENEDLAVAQRQARLDLLRAERELGEFLTGGLADSPNLRSPVGGRVQEVRVQPGESVRNGQVLLVIEREGSVFEVQVTSDEAGRVAVGDRVEVRSPEFSGALEGRVREVADYQVTSADGRTWMTPVWVEMGGGQLVRAGMTGDAWIHTATGAIQRSGVALPREQTRVSATADAEVEDVFVREGAVVGAGAPLIAFSAAQLREARESRHLAVEVARARLGKATRDLAALRVTSPVEGTLVKLIPVPGDSVRMGEEVAVVAGLEYMELAIDVDEFDIAGVGPGMPVRLQVEALGDAVYDGEVVGVALEGKVGDGVTTFAVTIRVPNPERTLRSGMTAEAVITIDRRENVLVVPAEAVQVRGNAGTVRVLVDGQAVPRLIEVGIAGTRLVEVTGGLEEGDQVAVAAQAGTGLEQLIRLRPTTPMMPGTIPGGARQRPSGQ